MLKQEAPYTFQKALCQPHKRIYAAKKQTPEAEELVLQDGLTIGTAGLDTVAKLAVKDFAAYLKTAFGIKVRLTDGKADITAVVDQADLGSANGYMGRKITVSDSGISIQAYDERGIAQAFYSLEDQMNARQAPFLKKTVTEQKPLFSPRMIHSAYELDVFPDEYLSVCAHHGYDAILVFVKDATHTPLMEYDFNDLVRRAARYGIDVYAYSYMTLYMHPDDEGAKEAYADLYGGLFRAVPGLKGIVFVGESADFPSKDPHVYAPKPGDPPSDNIPHGKLRPGWYPCYDYIDWVTLVRDSIHNVKPDADIVFWTYNFGRASEETRVKFVENLPSGVSLMVTFSPNQALNLGNSKGWIRDYSLHVPTASPHYLAEAAAAKRKGVRLYSQVNTAGRTWDFGVTPYEPFPGQWHKRHEAILESQKQHGLCGLMENHHFGFTPSFISLQAKEAYTLGGRDYDTYLTTWAKNLAGEDFEKLLHAMELLDESNRNHVPSQENQYGPYRVGPAFPFCLKATVKQPDKKPGLLWGHRICYTHIIHEDEPYRRFDPYALRRADEIRMGKKAIALCKDALKLMRSIRHKTAELEKLINMVEFMCRCHITTVHFREFSICKEQLQLADTWKKSEKIADKIEHICKKEIENTLATIPLVQKDSSLGFEASMDYVCDEESLRWKLKHMDHMLKKELTLFRPL